MRDFKIGDNVILHGKIISYPPESRAMVELGSGWSIHLDDIEDAQLNPVGRKMRFWDDDPNYFVEDVCTAFVVGQSLYLYETDGNAYKNAELIEDEPEATEPDYKALYEELKSKLESLTS